MVAAFDIGNSNIHLGLYRDKRLIKWSLCPTHNYHIDSTISKMLIGKHITGAAIASVVPKATARAVSFLKRQYKVVPIIISAKLNCHLKFSYRRPTTLGADRIANAVGGMTRYKKNLIIISFGTATTIDVVLKGGYHLGGLITPGMGMLLGGLVEQTALLRKVVFHKPDRHIGKSTEECIQSGVVNGAITMIRGLIKGIRCEVKRKLLCVATGGWGKQMAKYIEEIDCFDRDITTFGVMKLFEYNA
jgi:type III pantothenate kinase